MFSGSVLPKFRWMYLEKIIPTSIPDASLWLLEYLTPKKTRIHRQCQRSTGLADRVLEVGVGMEFGGWLVYFFFFCHNLQLGQLPQVVGTSLLPN